MDTKLFGIRISALRKDRELTQADMADALHISYQAVSSWERGETMPDITKLPEIAALLDVSINDLFTLDSAPQNATQSAPKNESKVIGLPCDTPASAGPTPLFAPPVIAPPTPPAPPPPPVQEFSIKRAMDMLPFVDRETAGDIAKKMARYAAEQGLDPSGFQDALPYISRSAADDLVRLAIKKGQIGEIDEYFPYISRDFAGELVAHKLAEGVVPESLLDAMPFIRKDVADQIVLRLIENRRDFDLDEIMPFVSRSAADAAVRYRLDAGDTVEPDEVLPFLSREMAGELALKWLNLKKNED